MGRSGGGMRMKKFFSKLVKTSFSYLHKFWIFWRLVQHSLRDLTLYLFLIIRTGSTNRLRSLKTLPTKSTPVYSLQVNIVLLNFQYILGEISLFGGNRTSNIILVENLATLKERIVYFFTEFDIYFFYLPLKWCFPYILKYLSR